jgi:hypothetical protein
MPNAHDHAIDCRSYPAAEGASRPSGPQAALAAVQLMGVRGDHFVRGVPRDSRRLHQFCSFWRIDGTGLELLSGHHFTASSPEFWIARNETPEELSPCRAVGNLDNVMASQRRIFQRLKPCALCEGLEPSRRWTPSDFESAQNLGVLTAE